MPSTFTICGRDLTGAYTTPGSIILPFYPLPYDGDDWLVVNTDTDGFYQPHDPAAGDLIVAWGRGVGYPDNPLRIGPTSCRAYAAIALPDGYRWVGTVYDRAFLRHRDPRAFLAWVREQREELPSMTRGIARDFLERSAGPGPTGIAWCRPSVKLPKSIHSIPLPLP